MIIHLLFWSSLALISYIYFLYPLALFASAFFKHPRRIIIDEHTPPVSIIIAAHNEEQVIAAKLDNLLTLDYPAEQLEIIVASDGSTDDTDAIVAAYAERGVTLLPSPGHPGKTAVQNDAAARARGDILVFSDANALYAPNAVRKLVRHFTNPDIGCVGGLLRYTSRKPGAAGIGEVLYWRYESFLKRQESRSGSIIGVNGAIYAIRKELYGKMAEHLMSDLVISLRIRELGYRAILEPDACAFEPVYENVATTFRVKRRIILRAISSVASEARFLNLFRFKYFAIKLISHKLLRWLVPFFLVVIFCSNLFLLEQPFFLVAFIVQSLFYLLGFLGFWLELLGARSIIFYIPFYFCLVNLAALVSIIDFLCGRRITTWEPAR